MTNRLIVAAVAILLAAGSTFAQETNDVLPEAPAVTVMESPLSSFLPVGSEPAASGQFWATGDYMFTFVRGMQLPNLVTTSTFGTPQATAGVIGAPTTSTLFSGFVNEGMRSGFRLGTGYWFSADKKFGIEAGFMLVGDRSRAFNAVSNDGTILARPYTDATTNLQQAVLVAFPGSSNGTIDIVANSGVFHSANINIVEQSYDVGWFRLTSLYGYRYYGYDESVRIRQTISPTPGNVFPFPPGTQIVNTDNFHTRNIFHGVDMGLRSQFFWENWSLDILTKVAFGRITRTFSIDGDQVATAPGVATIAQPGGVLALSTNAGSTSTGDWKVMPEFGATLNWQISSNISARVGYSFILLNGVARAGDQIDTTVNPNFFSGGTGPGPIRPSADRIRTDMWIQALNLGLQFNY